MKYKVSITTAIILLITSFLPILQIIIITINGGIISVISQKNLTLQYIINGLGSILFLIVYYLSTARKKQIFSIIGFLFFFFPLISYSSEKIMPKEPYFIEAMLIGLISGIILVLMDMLKQKVIK